MKIDLIAGIVLLIMAVISFAGAYALYPSKNWAIIIVLAVVAGGAGFVWLIKFLSPYLQKHNLGSACL